MGKKKGKGRGGEKKKKKKKKVLVETFTTEDGIEFYSIDLEREEVVKLGTEVLEKEGIMACLVPYGNGGATPRIYLMGSECMPRYRPGKADNEKQNERGFVHSGVSYVDVGGPESESESESESEWKAGPPHPVRAPDPFIWLPACCLLGNKIYCFTHRAHKAEVYDPKLNKWSHVIPPPKGLPNFRIEKPAFADPSNNRLLICLHGNGNGNGNGGARALALAGDLPSTGSLYAYYPDGGRWDLLVPKFDPKSFVLALQSGVIFSYVPDKFRNTLFTAFDVDSNRHLNVTYSNSNFDHRLWTSQFSALLNLGNSFLCLVAPGLADSRTPPEVVILAIQFKIRRTTPHDVVITPFPGNFFSLRHVRHPIAYSAF